MTRWADLQGDDSPAAKCTQDETAAIWVDTWSSSGNLANRSWPTKWNFGRKCLGRDIESLFNICLDNAGDYLTAGITEVRSEDPWLRVWMHISGTSGQGYVFLSAYVEWH